MKAGTAPGFGLYCRGEAVQRRPSDRGGGAENSPMVRGAIEARYALGPESLRDATRLHAIGQKMPCEGRFLCDPDGPRDKPARQFLRQPFSRGPPITRDIEAARPTIERLLGVMTSSPALGREPTIPRPARSRTRRQSIALPPMPDSSVGTQASSAPVQFWAAGSSGSAARDSR